MVCATGIVITTAATTQDEPIPTPEPTIEGPVIAPMIEPIPEEIPALEITPDPAPVPTTETLPAPESIIDLEPTDPGYPIPWAENVDENPDADCRIYGNKECGVLVHGVWYNLDFETMTFYIQ